MMIVLHLLSEPLKAYLEYDRVDIKQYEWWRFLTANLVHSNTNHLLMNGAGLAVIGLLHSQYYSLRYFFIVFVVLSLSVAIGIYFFAADIRWYVGLSGVLHGLITLGAVLDILKHERTGWLLLIGTILKVSYEQIWGASEEVADLIGVSVGTDAHLYGAIAGIILALVYIKFRQSVKDEK